MTPHPTTIPADLFGDALLRDWCGPLEWDPGDGDWLDATRTLDEAVLLRDSAGPFVEVDVADCRLPLARPECRANVLRVLARGDGCPCDGICQAVDWDDMGGPPLEVRCVLPVTGHPGHHEGRQPGHPNPTPLWGFHITAKPCERCNGSGYLRRPAPAWHLVTPDEGGTLLVAHSQHSAALLAHHALDVARGGRGVVEVWERLPQRGADNAGARWRRVVPADDGYRLHATAEELLRGPVALLDGDVLRMGVTP
jgi:hypothetical protein